MYREWSSKTKLSFSSFCLHLQSVAIANNCNTVPLTLLRSWQYYQQESVTEARGIWILKDFLFVSLSPSLWRRSTLFHPTSTLGFFTLHTSSLNKGRSAVRAGREREKFSLCVVNRLRSLFSLTSSRYSGICLLGNVVSGKTYRQLSDRMKREKDYFSDAGVSRWE